MVRPVELRPADPGREEVAEDGEGADVARQAVEKGDERVDLGVVLPQVASPRSAIGTSAGITGARGRRSLP
jgi:hypothetical protein